MDKVIMPISLKLFYVYELWVEGQHHPFYVGKTFEGSRRLLGHLAESRRGSNSLKSKYIRKYGSVVEKIVFTSAIESEVMTRESAVILSYGRIDLGTGPLTNQTFGWEGPCGLELPDELKDLFYNQGSTQRVSKRKIEVSAHLECGKYVGTYPSIKQAAESLSLELTAASKVSRGSEGRMLVRDSNGVGYRFSKGRIENDIPALTREPRPSSKRIQKLSMDGGVLEEYSSILTAAKSTGYARSSIARSSTLGKPYRGIFWKRVDNP